jgi:hypothetical protein
MNMRFGARDAPFIRISGTKKTHPKIQPSSPPILGVKWGAGMENVEKNVLKFDYLGRYDRY